MSVEYNRYSLTNIGKRELQFRAFATSYGLLALNTLMNYHFPTKYTLEHNLTKLVEIFGTYVVYCLIEATRLIGADKNNQDNHWHSSYFESPNNFRNGKFKEAKFVNRWIKDIFSPWHMLNLFLTAVSNSQPTEKGIQSRHPKIDNVFLLKQIKQHEKERNQLRRSGIPIKSVDSTNSNVKKKKKDKLPPPTLDLMLRRSLSIVQPFLSNQLAKPELLENVIQNSSTGFDFFKIRSQYNEDSLLYELNMQQIEELRGILRKNYPISYECLQTTDNIFYSKEQ